MIDQTLRDTKQKMQAIVEALSHQLKTLQAGRATTAMVDHLTVELYGSQMPMKQVGSITVPEANQLVITPWDKGALGPIETAIRTSDLGVNPINDGTAVRIVLPALTEERRRELTKVVGQMVEEARIAMRNHRRDAWDAIQAAQKAGTLTEDDRDRGRDELDKLVDAMNKQAERIGQDKEAELLRL